MGEVTDPALLAQLNGTQAGEVTDPALLAQLNGTPSAQSFSQVKQPLGAMDYAAAVPESAAQMASGLIAQPVAGLAGLGAMAGKALGYNWDPASVVEGAQSAMTYSPRTQGGQALSSAIGYLPQKLASAANTAGGAVTDLTGSPLLGTAANTGIQGLPLLLGAGLTGRAAAATMSPEVANAAGLGLKLTPTQAGGGFMARSLESLSGSAKLERNLSTQNTPVINQIGRNELGVPSDVPLSKTSIEQANQPAYSVINAVKGTGTVTFDDAYRSDIGAIQPPQGEGALPINSGISGLQGRYGQVEADDAGNIVNHIRQLRADASDNIKAPMEPDKNALGRAQLQVANALENQLDRHIQSGAFVGPDGSVAPDLIDQYRAARVQIAKSHTILDSLDSENLDAADLGKRLDRGQYMAGPLRQLAVAGQNFPRAVQVPSALRNSGPFSNLGAFGLAASLVHPSVLAAVVGPPLARAALASGRYQRYGIQGLRTAPTFPGLAGTRYTMPLVNQEQNDQPLALPGY